MKQNTAADAVGYFSDNATEFDSYYRSNPEFQERLDIWRELLDRHSGLVAFDMGCGSGVFTFYLAAKGGQVVGVDGAPDMVKLCESRRRERGLTNVRFVEGRLPNVDEAALGQADLVISSSVVEYVEDLDAVLALFSRLLKSGGTLIVSMPNLFCINRLYQRAKHALTGEPKVYAFIRHFTSPGGLARRVAPLGLSLQGQRHYNHATRLARLTRSVGLPLPLTADLFVAVFRKS